MKKIKLTKGYFALVDDADFDRVNAHKWYASVESRNTKVYAKRCTKVAEKGRWMAKSVRMSHFVLDITPTELPEGHVVHHDNDDGLDNTRQNLEIITQDLNMKLVENWRKKKVEESICL